MSVSETLEEGSVCKKSTLRRAVCGVHCLQLGLFSNTLSLCFSLNARDQVSHPYKTTGKIQVPKISAGERQGRSPAEILGSNPTGGMDICLL